MNNYLARKSKIDFLKGLIKRERSLSELRIPVINVFHYNPEKNTYYSSKLKKTYTETEFEVYRQTRRGKYGKYITDIIIHHTIIDGVDTAKKIQDLE